jgi:hypothetical protein
MYVHSFLCRNSENIIVEKVDFSLKMNKQVSIVLAGLCQNKEGCFLRVRSPEALLITETRSELFM